MARRAIPVPPAAALRVSPGRTARDIAIEFGVSIPTVRIWRMKRGLMKPRSDRCFHLLRDRAWMAEQVKAGWTDREIAARVGCSWCTVALNRRVLGMRKPEPWKFAHMASWSDRRKAMASWTSFGVAVGAALGMSQADIAREIGVSRQRVEQILRRDFRARIVYEPTGRAPGFYAHALPEHERTFDREAA